MSWLSLAIFVVLSLFVGLSTKAREARIITRLLVGGIVFLAFATIVGALFGYTSADIGAMYKFSATSTQDPLSVGSSIVVGYSLLVGALIVAVRRFAQSLSGGEEPPNMAVVPDAPRASFLAYLRAKRAARRTPPR